eukprot:1161200-Pelagomonas_calceolata.AAC.15
MGSQLPLTLPCSPIEGCLHRRPGVHSCPWGHRPVHVQAGRSGRLEAVLYMLRRGMCSCSPDTWPHMSHVQAGRSGCLAAVLYMLRGGMCSCSPDTWPHMSHVQAGRSGCCEEHAARQVDPCTVPQAFK